MDRRGYSAAIRDGRNKCFTSRADRAVSWRTGQQLRNNENGDNTMVDLDDIKFHPYPQPPLFSRSSSFSSDNRGRNNNNKVQGATDTSFPFQTASTSTKCDTLLPPPPGLRQHNNGHPLQVPSTNIASSHDGRYSYENPLLNQFEKTKLTNNMNDLNDNNLFPFGSTSRRAEAPGQQQATTSWMPLVSKRLNYTQQQQYSTMSNATTYDEEKKKTLNSIGAPVVKEERQTHFTSWSRVVAKGLPSSRTSSSAAHHSTDSNTTASPPVLKSEYYSPAIKSAAAALHDIPAVAVPHMMMQYGEEEKSRLLPVNTYPTSLSDISLYELNSSSRAAGHHDFNEDSHDYSNNLNARANNDNNDRAATATKFISDSVGMITSGIVLFSDEPSMRPYTVIKIKNLPYNAASQDIEKLFKRFGNCIALPDSRTLPQCVHFIMDIKTGKTCGVCFVEVKAPRGREGLNRVLATLSRMPLQGRGLKLTLSSYDELRNSLFIYWKGVFRDGLADPTSGGSQRRGDSELFIGQRDLQKLLDICRNYKANYNRKCPERPFEYLMSITLNIPWLQTRTVCTIQRDILYECYKLATGALHFHTCKQIQTFDGSLLDRLIRVALLCDGFTVKQKVVIINASRLPCPVDLETKIQEIEATPGQLLNDQLMTLIEE